MKVAIIISGALRSFKTCYPGFQKYVLGPLATHKYGAAVDVYFHTWKMKLPYTKVQVKDEGSVEEAVKLYQPKVWRQDVYDQHMRDLLYTESGAAKFQAEVRSMKLKARKDGRWGHHTKCEVCNKLGFYGMKCRICGGTNIHNIIGYLYSLRESYRLVEEPESYDVVLKTRMDLWLKEPLNLRPCDSQLLYLPDNDERDFPCYGSGHNDQIAYGGPEVMKVYCSQYDSFYRDAMKNILDGIGIGTPHKSIQNVADAARLKCVSVPLKYCLERKK